MGQALPRMFDHIYDTKEVPILILYLPSNIVQKILPLLSEGELTIREISKRTDLSVTETINAIEFLREKGLVAIKTET